MEHSKKMMMVPFDSKHKTKKEGKIFSMPKQFFRIILTLGKANALNEKGEIKRGAHFIAGSDLSNLIKYVLGGKTEKPKHLLAFQNILKEHKITDEAVKDRKTKKALI